MHLLVEMHRQRDPFWPKLQAPLPNHSGIHVPDLFEDQCVVSFYDTWVHQPWTKGVFVPRPLGVVGLPQCGVLEVFLLSEAFVRVGDRTSLLVDERAFEGYI